MNIILLSGGSGRRLWPLSNETRSKQFLKLLRNQYGQPESMVQRVFGQIQRAGINTNIIVATSKSQRDSIQAQLGDAVDVVLEPERRDTFPAIVLASAYLAYKKAMDRDDVVLVLPVDPYTDLAYFEALLQMERLIADNVANIVLMGIKPTYPAAKYGYIVPSSDKITISRFVEKPNEATAEQLIAAGAYWNGGVFAFKLGYILDIASNYIPGTSFEGVESQFTALPRISFDYEVVEKEESIALVEYTGQWRDLGTWNTLTEVMDDQAIGRVILADSCENTHVINELDIPVTVVGAKDMVVVASPDGILASDKHQSSYLKTYVDSIEQRPMYEEYRWGDYKVLDYTSFPDNMIAVTKKVLIKSGQAIRCQAHAVRDEIWTIVDGSGAMLLDDQANTVTRGDVIHISKGRRHAVRALTDLHLIVVQIGLELTETDVEYYDRE